MNKEQLLDLSNRTETQLTELRSTYRLARFQILDDIYSIWVEAKQIDDGEAVVKYATDRQKTLLQLMQEQIISSVAVANFLQRQIEIEG